MAIDLLPDIPDVAPSAGIDLLPDIPDVQPDISIGVDLLPDVADTAPLAPSMPTDPFGEDFDDDAQAVVPPVRMAETLGALPAQIGQDIKAMTGGALRQMGEAREKNPIAFKNLAARHLSGDLPSKGLIKSGNIDIHKRPRVQVGEDISTVRSMSIGTNKGEVLIPTVSEDGRIMSDEEATEQYKSTGRHLGIFDSPQNATIYAKSLHQQQAQEYTEAPLSKAMRETGTEMFSEAQEELQRITPKDQTIVEKGISGAVRSVATVTPALIASILLKSPVPMAAWMGGTEKARSFGEAREKGLSFEEAEKYSNINSLIEVVTEYGPAKILSQPIKKLFKKGSEALNRFVQFMVLEVGGENVATTGQAVNAWLSGLDDDFTVERLLTEDLPITTVAATLGGGAQMGIAGGVRTLAEPTQPPVQPPEAPIIQPAPKEIAPIGEPQIAPEPIDLLPDIPDVVQPEAREVAKEGVKPIPEVDTKGSVYEEMIETWFQEKDLKTFQNEVEAKNIKKRIKETVGKQPHFFLRPIKRGKFDQAAKDVDEILQIYIDLKPTESNPDRPQEMMAKYGGQISKEQQELVRKALEIENNPEMKQIAEDIIAADREMGLEAQDADVISNLIENHLSRHWKPLRGKTKTESFRKFGTTTGLAKGRTFESILEGWSLGRELAIKGASNSLLETKNTLAATIENKKLISVMTGAKNEQGQPLLSSMPKEGYVQIEHPSFKRWEYGGKVEPEPVELKDIKLKEMVSADTVVTEEGTVLKKKTLYAPEAVAKDLNTVLGTSKLKGHKAIDIATKYNAVMKAWILQTSLFHHQAFARSYLLGTTGKTLKEWNVRQAYKDGLQAAEDMNEDLQLIVKNGLTLGNLQDWEESILRQEDTIFGRALDRAGPIPKAIKDKINALRESQADFLFKELGAGLKAKAALIEHRNLLKKHPDMDANERAGMVARLINADFGGLHLQRLRRNPTTQHFFRLLALAPDWTESNIRTMVKAVKSGTKAETAFYRRFWASVLTKGVTATVLANILMAAGDDEDAIKNFKKAWKAGHFRWMGVDITPIAKLFGDKTGRRKYFSLIGHFKDPMKFIFHPVRSAHHKGSVLYRTIHEALVGTNWQGRKFTTWKELMGIDGKGKQKGKLTKWGPGGPVEYEQFPSYLLSQLRGTQPVQLQALISYQLGEIDGFNAISRSIGLAVSGGPKPKKKKKSKYLRE